MRIIMSLEQVQVKRAHSVLYYYIIFALRADAVIENVPPEVYVRYIINLESVTRKIVYCCARAARFQ